VFETAECEEDKAFHIFGAEIWKARESNERWWCGSESKLLAVWQM